MELSEFRKKIDEIDGPLLDLFLERMKLSGEIAEYKKANSMPILNKGREREILNGVMEKSGDMEQYAHHFFFHHF
jgi:chorismate mutase/prephenate dehydratase